MKIISNKEFNDLNYCGKLDNNLPIDEISVNNINNDLFKGLFKKIGEKFTEEEEFINRDISCKGKRLIWLKKVRSLDGLVTEKEVIELLESIENDFNNEHNSTIEFIVPENTSFLKDK